MSAYLRLRPGPYSFLGTEPRLVLTAKNDRLTLRHGDGRTERLPDGNPLEAQGVQFHPESILTIEGKKLLANFLES